MSGSNEQKISEGRACVRLIESVTILLASSALNEKDTVILGGSKSLARERLRRLVADLPPDVTAQILAASDKLSGPIGEIDKN